MNFLFTVLNEMVRSHSILWVKTISFNSS